MAVAPTTTKIMIIRHGEKPPSSDDDESEGKGAGKKKKELDGPPFGVDADGKGDNESLIIQGWQRAGGLACLFAPTHGPLQNAELATPQFLFASDSSSERPLETITPLASKLGLTPSMDKKGDFADIANQAMACGGTALICWQHGDIPQMANQILGNDNTVPQKWPGSRYDVVWVFDLDANTGTYGFSQVPQSLLAGDSPDPIS